MQCPASFIVQVTQQHQKGSQGKKTLNEPDWTKRQADQIYPIEAIAEVAQKNLAQAVGFQVPGAESFKKHGEIAEDKDPTRE